MQLARALEESAGASSARLAREALGASDASREKHARAAAAAARGLLLTTRVAHALSVGASASGRAQAQLVAVGKRAVDVWSARLPVLLRPLAQRCALEAAKGAEMARGATAYDDDEDDVAAMTPSAAIVRLLHDASRVSAGAFGISGRQGRDAGKGGSDEAAAEASVLAALRSAAPAIALAVANACVAEYSAALAESEGARGRRESVGRGPGQGGKGRRNEAVEVQLLLDLRFAAGPGGADDAERAFSTTLGAARYAALQPIVDATVARAAAATSLLLRLGWEGGSGRSTARTTTARATTRAAETAGTMDLCAAPPPLPLLPVPSLSASAASLPTVTSRPSAAVGGRTAGGRSRAGGSSRTAAEGRQLERRQRQRQRQQRERDTTEDLDVLSNVGNLANKLFSGWN